MVEEVLEDRSPATSARPEPEDNSVGRLLTLSDGVFAIAMTLLALDLKVPDLVNPTNGLLAHTLRHQSGLYASFLASFYIIASYWLRHRHIMRSVVKVGGTLFRDSLALLLVIAAMPFPASLLGQYGSKAIALAVYGATSALATGLLMRLSYDVRHYDLADPADRDLPSFHRDLQGWFTMLVFLLCIPSGYVFVGKGPYVLILLIIPSRVALLRQGLSWVRRRRAA